MMKFRAVKQRLVEVLDAGAQGRLRVIGAPRQGQDVQESRNLPLVQVFYTQGNFPKNRGAQNGPAQHVTTFSIGVTVSAAAKCDLSAITTPGAPATQKAAALAAALDASEIADALLDEALDQVWNILMDLRNIDLGFKVGVISDRWVDGMTKEDPQPAGTLVTSSGTAHYSCQISEAVIGETGVPLTGGIGTVLDITGDDVERTGVDVA